MAHIRPTPPHGVYGQPSGHQRSSVSPASANGRTGGAGAPVSFDPVEDGTGLILWRLDTIAQDAVEGCDDDIDGCDG